MHYCLVSNLFDKCQGIKDLVYVENRKKFRKVFTTVCDIMIGKLTTLSVKKRFGVDMVITMCNISTYKQ